MIKNEKTLRERVQFIIAMISFVGTVFLFIFLLGKDVQSSDGKTDLFIEKNIQTIDKVESLTNDLKDYKTTIDEIKEKVSNIDKKQEVTNVLFDKFINEEWKEMKSDLKEYMKREK
jgi:flagellar basal body-associated protein FliL